MLSNLLLRVFIPSFLVFLSVACSNVEPSDFYEVEGLVSGGFTDTTYAQGWKLAHHINSIGLSNNVDSSAADEPGSVAFTVYISNPGRYAFWVLAAPDETETDTSKIDVHITAPDGFLVAASHIEMPGGVYLKWHQAETTAGENLFNFEQSGQYTITISPRESRSVHVHKIQMSANNHQKPFGLGYPSSSRTDLTAADLFREEPIMLPPGWVFEPIVGNEHTSTNSVKIGTIANLLPEAPGGVWTSDSSATIADGINSDDLAAGIEVLMSGDCRGEAKQVYERGFRFIMSESTRDISCIKSAHQAYQQQFGPEKRPVLFHGVENMYLPEMKQYPAPMTPVYKFAWSREADMLNGSFKPGGYRELVRDLTDPAGSLYGIPFLSMPFDISYSQESVHSRDGELFQRFVQLAAFLPVMHLTLPQIDRTKDESLSNDFSSTELKAIEESMALRNHLFPFHYTHAHYTRQTNESVVTGFWDHPDQYLYGDSFLVAPVVEPGANGRLIYFPDGRFWYDYHSGETYEAGQSWFVDTSRDKLPLFVKAGSVIPYQTNGSDEQLKVEIYSGDAGAFRLVQDDNDTRGYRQTKAARTMFRYNEIEGRYKLTIGAVQAGYEGMPEIRTYELHFKYINRPKSVEINGERVEMVTGEESSATYGWRYEEEDETLIVELIGISKDLKQDVVIFP